MAGDTNPNRAPRLSRPDGLDDQEWTLLRLTKSWDMASAIRDADAIVHASDSDALADFLQVSKDAERDSLRRYLHLQTSLGSQIAKAQAEYLGHRERSDRLYRLITGVDVERSAVPVGD